MFDSIYSIYHLPSGLLIVGLLVVVGIVTLARVSKKP